MSIIHKQTQCFPFSFEEFLPMICKYPPAFSNGSNPGAKDPLKPPPPADDFPSRDDSLPLGSPKRGCNRPVFKCRESLARTQGHYSRGHSPAAPSCGWSRVTSPTSEAQVCWEKGWRGCFLFLFVDGLFDVYFHRGHMLGRSPAQYSRG